MEDRIREIREQRTAISPAALPTPRSSATPTHCGKSRASTRGSPPSCRPRTSTRAPAASSVAPGRWSRRRTTPRCAALAQQEVDELRPRVERLETRLKDLLAPRDPLDDRDAVVEIRAGTGGDEAALFAGDLLRMYTRFAEGAALADGAGHPLRGRRRRRARGGGRAPRKQRLRGAALRVRGAPGAARPCHREPGPHPHLGRHRGGPSRGGGGRRQASTPTSCASTSIAPRVPAGSR
jgi:hypothetical protein